MIKIRILWIAALLFPGTYAKTLSPAGFNSPNIIQPVAGPEKGMIIGQGVRIRKDSSLQSAELTKVSTGEMVDILGVSASKLPLSQIDACEQYPMINVRTAGGKEGWVFGKYVFRILDHSDKLPTENTVKFNGRSLQLKLCRNYSLGASNEDGMTGCDEFYPVLLYDAGTKKAFPVELSCAEPKISSFIFWNLEDDDGAGEIITTVTIDSSTRAVAYISASHMEGCSKYEIVVVQKNGKFTATCRNSRYFEEEDCN